jgi:hypothetical protein
MRQIVLISKKTGNDVLLNGVLRNEVHCVQIYLLFCCLLSLE